MELRCFQGISYPDTPFYFADHATSADELKPITKIYHRIGLLYLGKL
jgi:hypothetical protein